jgi:hypothetical protein
VQAFKYKGEGYQLIWPDKPEFVRMAARYGATIVPFGAVGAEEMFTQASAACTDGPASCNASITDGFIGPLCWCSLAKSRLCSFPFFKSVNNQINCETVSFAQGPAFCLSM